MLYVGSDGQEAITEWQMTLSLLDFTLLRSAVLEYMSPC